MNSVRLLSKLKRIRRVTSTRYESTQTQPIDDGTTHFGFQKVTPEEKGRQVYEVFHKVADKYDIMNDAMSIGIHRCWKDIFMERLSPTQGTNLLDVAGGTGDIAFRFVNYTDQTSKVTVFDINEDMLRVGKERAKKLAIAEDRMEWVQGNAEELPFPDNTFSAYTIAFGMRNITNMSKAIDEAYRVLKPGGRFLCLEFSRVNNEVIKQIYDLYSFQVIPVVGQVLAGDWKSYQYLVESIRQFPSQDEYKDMIEKAGFWSVNYENLTFGIVAIHSGFKL